MKTKRGVVLVHLLDKLDEGDVEQSSYIGVVVGYGVGCIVVCFQ